MSVLKATPGPWRVQKNEYGDIVVDSDSIGVCNVGREPQNGQPAIANFGHEQGPAVEADANLIAAAPDMFAALDELVDFLRAHVAVFKDYNPLTEQADVALRKARGEQIGDGQ